MFHCELLKTASFPCRIPEEMKKTCWTDVPDVLIYVTKNTVKDRMINIFNPGHVISGHQPVLGGRLAAGEHLGEDIVTVGASSEVKQLCVRTIFDEAFKGTFEAGDRPADGVQS